MPILVFLGLSVLGLGPMYATDRQTSDVRHAASFNAPTVGAGIINNAMHGPYHKRRLVKMVGKNVSTVSRRSFIVHATGIHYRRLVSIQVYIKPYN